MKKTVNSITSGLISSNCANETDKLGLKEYQKVKIRLAEHQKRKNKQLLIVSLFCMLCFTATFLIIIQDALNEPISLFMVLLSVVAGGFVTALFLLYLSMIFDIQESKMRRIVLEYEANNALEDTKEDMFENSIKLSYKYLDQYYLQTREQAQRGFFVTVCVAVLGAILIFIGVVAMFLDKVAPSYITSAAGVITEFIAAIFFYLYNKTVSSMSKYHNKLVLSQNISIALRVAESLPETEKCKAKDMIITQLLNNINDYLVQRDSDNTD